MYYTHFKETILASFQVQMFTHQIEVLLGKPVMLLQNFEKLYVSVFFYMKVIFFLYKHSGIILNLDNITKTTTQFRLVYPNSTKETVSCP